MPTVTDILRADVETMPAWLRSAGTDFDAKAIENFFSSRVVYYPGAGQDGRAFALFGATHSAHCFLHIDLEFSGEQIQAILDSGGNKSVRGYALSSSLILPESLSRLFNLPRRRSPGLALWAILQRQLDYSDAHGPERLAFLHVQAEAVSFCSSVWGQLDKEPFGVILQDHGFGGVDGHPAEFGGDKALHGVAQTTALSKYLLVAKNTAPWPQYEVVSEMTETGYGEHSHRVRLYRQGGAPKG